MADSDDRSSPDERSGPDDPRRVFVRPAEPTPVTEAMVTPRTTPSDPEEAEEIEVRFCQSCGRRNTSGGSYCLACGVRFLRPDAPPAGLSEARDEQVTPQPTGDRPVVGVTESPTPYWDEEDDLAGPPARSSPTLRRVRFLLVMIVVVAILFLGFNAFQNRETEPVEESEQNEAVAPTVAEEQPTTTLPAPDDTELRLYVVQISAVADDVAELTVTGREVNDAWDNRTQDYDTTREQMSALASRAAALPDRLAAITPPDGADPIGHQRLVRSLSTLASAAEGMKAGLESADTGETRHSELARFEDASSEFGGLVAELEGSTGSPPGSG